MEEEDVVEPLLVPLDEDELLDDEEELLELEEDELLLEEELLELEELEPPPPQAASAIANTHVLDSLKTLN